MNSDKTFQIRVAHWLYACFGEKIAGDREERTHRFLEEALELTQALGCTKNEALQLVEYVYSRSVGETNQEIGGVMLTLAALCNVNNMDMANAGERELLRVWENIDRIREKQAKKPKGSPLPK